MTGFPSPVAKRRLQIQRDRRKNPSNQLSVNPQRDTGSVIQPRPIYQYKLQTVWNINPGQVQHQRYPSMASRDNYTGAVFPAGVRDRITEAGDAEALRMGDSAAIETDQMAVKREHCRTEGRM